MRNALVAIVVSSCGFSKHAGSTDGSTIDTSLPDGTVTRLVDIADAKVTGGPHADFPVVVATTVAAAHPMGFDIWFSLDAGGAMRLAHDIERYDAGTGKLVAWVKIPQLAANTTFYLHYGDKTITTNQEMKQATWSANFAAVFHMTDLSDARAQNTATNTNTTSAAGQLALARAFDGTASINAGSAAAIDNVFAGGGTVDAWFFATTLGTNALGRIFDKQSTIFAMCGTTALQLSRYFEQNASQGGFGTWCTPVGSVSLNAWTYVAVTYDEGSDTNVPTIYVNGVARTAAASANPQGAAQSDALNAAGIGDRIVGGGRAFDGRIDEVRIAKAIRSAGWIATSYENQRDPAAFCVVAPE